MPPKRNQNRQKSHNKNSKNSSKEAQPPAENAMAHCILPQDIILSILSRLPVKSLVRFKCVCKPWYNLVSKPSFVKMHAQKFPHTPKTFSFQSHVLKCPRLGIDPPKKLTLVNPNNSHEIYVDACNGLVCMGRPLYTKDIMLWNPATSMHKFLPPSTVDLGAAPAMVSLGFGFCCSADGDDYKVVRISILKGKKMRVGVEVYSSASDSWRKMDLNLEYKFTLLEHKNHVIVNGNPFWLACFYEKKRISEGRECRVLLGFDCTRMEFLFVPNPNIENMGDKLPFVNWKGRVGLLSCAKKGHGDWLEWIDVFVYDDGDREWKRDARFGPVEVEADMCLDISRAGKIVGGCPDGRLFVYDPEKNRVGVSKCRKRGRCSFQMFAYEESLVHLKGMVPVVVNKEDHGDKLNDIEGFFVFSFQHGSGEISCYYALAF